MSVEITMHEEQKYLRHVQTSVTNFLHCGDDYLFLQRSNTKRIDPGKLNGIGGRVEPGENYAEAVIRETLEETGYRINMTDVQLAGVVKLEGGYSEDWVMCFFKTRVERMIIPVGAQTEDGELLGLHKDEVLGSEHELVDDLHYCFSDIVEDKKVFFMTAQVGEDQKIIAAQISKLNR